MTARAIDPNNGWVFEDGRWVWEGGATTGHIEDGTVQGQITTWDVAKTEWTPEGNLSFDAGGRMYLGEEKANSHFYSNGAMISRRDVGNHFQAEFSDGTEGYSGRHLIGALNSDTGEYTVRIGTDGDATFSGTVDAAGFTVNGQPISGGGGLPDGGYTYGWNITATDFIATSDERAKDNITTAPVGLIDSLKGREWEWKESGEKGSGVVAQELEQVLPHLVHEDDDGMKSVSYMGLCAYLIEELKDCRERLAVLEAKE